MSTIPTPDPYVYISVLNWNGADNTIQCVKTLGQLEYDNYKILIVDNASTDDSVGRIRQELPEIEIIQSDANLGFAGGHLLTMQRALRDHADLVWILNNDVIVSVDALSHLVRAYQQHGEALYGSVPIAAIDETGVMRLAFTPDRFKPNYKPKLIVLHRSFDYHEVFPDTQVREASALSGSSMIVPTDVVRKYGFMDNRFFLYAEETDYCYRMRYHGVQSLVVPASIVVHSQRGSSKGARRLKAVVRYYQVRNSLIFTRQHHTRNEYRMVLCKTVLRVIFSFFRIITDGKSAARHNYYALLGVRDAIVNRTGKTLSPEDYLG